MSEANQFTPTYNLVCLSDTEEISYCCRMNNKQSNSKIIYLTTNKRVKTTLEEEGVQSIFLIKPNQKITIPFQEHIKQSFIFEHGLLSTSLLLQFLNFHVSCPITILTNSHYYPIEMYQKLGANHVKYLELEEDVNYLFM